MTPLKICMEVIVSSPANLKALSLHRARQDALGSHLPFKRPAERSLSLSQFIITQAAFWIEELIKRYLYEICKFIASVELRDRCCKLQGQVICVCIVLHMSLPWIPQYSFERFPIPFLDQSSLLTVFYLKYVRVTKVQLTF